MNLLCVDIGGTRIKAAILSADETLESLSKKKLYTMRTLGWMNQSLPELFNKDLWASLVSLIAKSEKYDAISICLPGTIREDGVLERRDLWKYNGVTDIDIRKAIGKHIKCNVYVMNDAEAWLKGALEYCNLIKYSFRYPCFLISLGTGVGLSVVDEKSISQIEISALKSDFPLLNQASHHSTAEAWNVHKIIGETFFRWVEKNETRWNYETIRDEYTKRVLAFLKDMKSTLSNYGNLGTLFIGGGNAEFVSVRKLKELFENSKILPLSLQSELQLDKPDLIPLIGLTSVIK